MPTAPRLTHRQIELFRAVMRTGQLTRAAELLHSSQPTLSRELARLEQVLGFALFERLKGRLRPTVRALALLQEVEASFVGLERIAATALALRGHALGRLELAALPALTQVLLPEALARLARDEPEAAVTITPLESPALESGLSDQRHDLGLSEQREAPVACQLRPLLVADEVAVLPPGHALAARPVLAPEDLAGQPFISLAPADAYRQQIDAMFTARGIARHLRLESPSAASVCALVRQGLGLAIVNPLTALAWTQAAAEEAGGGGLVLRPLTVSIPFHVAVLRPQWRSRHPLRDALEAALVEAAEALVARLRLAGVDSRVPPPDAPPAVDGAAAGRR
ncbi:MAG: HTH-type transcriptional activator CmpR [Pseudomonadota bacterium]